VKIAFALIPEKGHVNPNIGPAQALVEAGHEVVIGAPGDICDQITRAGLVFRTDLIPERPLGRVTRGAELVELIQDPARLDGWIEQLLLGGVAEQVPELLEWYQREHADIVVVDPLYYAAAIAAHLASLPWAAVSNSLNPVIPASLDSALLRTVRRLSPHRDELFRGYGMEGTFSGPDVLSPYLNVAFATEAFAGPPREGVVLVGPSFPLRNRGDDVPVRLLETERSVIYASFGSQIYFWPDIFKKILKAGLALDAHMIFAMGDLVDDPRWKAPVQHCEIYRYAPQLVTLLGASVFVTHGGANSVMEALAAGVPMLVSPMCNDQFHQAYFVEKTGTGCVENLIEAPVERIVEHLRFLLCDHGVRSSMLAVSKTYQVDGARRAAELIEGCGFDPAKPNRGKGPTSMARRMKDIGGSATWTPGSAEAPGLQPLCPSRARENHINW
jgi:UDP:flavonoid glycosyltransferase YjiC (YdhE family)